MKHLNTQQKKGIIPIVQEQMNQDGNMQQQQKFEFDLFSLPKSTCMRLVKYVDECIANNEKRTVPKNENGVKKNDTESRDLIQD